MPISEGVSHIYLNVSDIDRTIAFYSDLFGFETVFDTTMEGPDFDAVIGTPNAWCRSVGGRVGDMRLEFIMTNYTPSSPMVPGVGMAAFAFQVRDAAEAQRRAVALGATTSGPPNEVHGCRIFFIDDPDGVCLEILEYLKDGPAWSGEGARRELVALRGR